MKKQNGSNNAERKRKLTEQEVTGLLSTIKNSGQGGNAMLQKKALDMLVKNGGVNKLLTTNK